VGIDKVNRPYESDANLYLGGDEMATLKKKHAKHLVFITVYSIAKKTRGNLLGMIFIIQFIPSIP
jgi:hypothetical protein